MTTWQIIYLLAANKLLKKWSQHPLAQISSILAILFAEKKRENELCSADVMSNSIPHQIWNHWALRVLLLHVISRQ